MLRSAGATSTKRFALLAAIAAAPLGLGAAGRRTENRVRRRDQCRHRINHRGGLAGRAGRSSARPRGAIATAAVTGLVAFVAAFSYLTPFAVNHFADYDPLFALHPINPQSIPEEGSEEAKYLDRFMSREQLSIQKKPIERLRERLRLRGEAIAANRLDLGFKALWLVALTLGLFLPTAVVGGWAADYLRRSRGRRWKNVPIYFELAIPTSTFFVLLSLSIQAGSIFLAPRINGGSDDFELFLLVNMFIVVALQGLGSAASPRRRETMALAARLLLCPCWAIPLAAPVILAALSN